MAETLAFATPELSLQDGTEVTAEHLILSAAGFAQRFDLEAPSEDVLKIATAPSPELPVASCTYMYDSADHRHMYV